jgi:antitoxin ParD1/3/4
MSMTSLNISLPEPLKQYVERQVASGDWGTPSEYVRELIRRAKENDKERRLNNLEQELVAAAKGPKIELPVAEIRRKGLIPALRERADSLKLEQLRRDIRNGLDSGPARPWSIAEVKREGRKQLSARRSGAKIRP